MKALKKLPLLLLLLLSLVQSWTQTNPPSLKVSFTWNVSPEPDVDFYYLYVSTLPFPAYQNLVQVPNRTNNFVTVSNIFKLDTTYYFWLTAVSAARLESGKSAVLTFTFPSLTSPPDAPILVSASIFPQFGLAQVYWKNATNNLGYYFQYSQGTNGQWTVSTFTTNSFFAAGGITNVPFRATVIATNKSGISPPLNLLFDRPAPVSSFRLNN
jgi:hypothetical protein